MSDYHDRNAFLETFTSKKPHPTVPGALISLQEQAVEHALTTDPPLCIFSEEVGVEGKRIYLVGSWKEMLKTISLTDFTKRTYYEMVMAKATMGRTMPVKLYADIEVDTSINHGYDVSPLQCTVESLVREAMRMLCPETNEAMQNAEFMWTNASNAKKHSFHMVLNLPGFAFQSAFSAGRLMLFVIALARMRKITCMTCNTMRNKEVVVRSPGDWTVYSSNRLFRMWCCTKKIRHAMDEPRWFLDSERRTLFEQGQVRQALTVDPEKDAELFYKCCATHFYPHELRNLKLLDVQYDVRSPEIAKVCDVVHSLEGVANILQEYCAPHDPAQESDHKPGFVKVSSVTVPPVLRQLVSITIPYAHVRDVRFFSSTSLLHAYTTDLQCGIYGTHRTNHIWFEFFCSPDESSRGYRQRCRDSYCDSIAKDRSKWPIHAFTPAQHQLVNTYWKERLPLYIPVEPCVKHVRDYEAQNTNKRIKTEHHCTEN